MIHRAYAIFDTKSLMYYPPFYSHTDNAAIRQLSDEVNSPNNMIGSHPADYILFFIGTYDDQKGALAPAFPLVHVVDAVGLVKRQAQLFAMPAKEASNG